jgi:pyrrolidone-carboxylate peptidase
VIQNRIIFYFFIILLLFLQPFHKSPKILLVGFQPFGKRNINISEKLVNDLKKEKNFDSLILPVSFDEAANIFNKKLMDSNYDLILMLGEHKNSFIRIDIAAQNYYEDIFEKGTINPNGSYFLFSPFAKNLPKINGLNYSNNAGKYVCNYIYYISLQKNLKALFIHVPELTLEQYTKEKSSLLSTLLYIIQYISKTEYYYN